MKRDDRIRLSHMLDSAKWIKVIASECKRDDLDNNRMLTNALVRELEIIGEAASKVSIDERDKLPKIPWRAIINMRNRLIHAYDKVDIDILWDTIINNIPQLIEDLERHL